MKEDGLLTPLEMQEALKPLQLRGVVNIMYPTLVVEAFLQAQVAKTRREIVRSEKSPLCLRCGKKIER